MKHLSVTYVNTTVKQKEGQTDKESEIVIYMAIYCFLLYLQDSGLLCVSAVTVVEFQIAMSVFKRFLDII